MGFIGAMARAALPIALALLLCAAPQAARAGACKKAGLKGGCVESGDIAPESLRAVDFRNQSQGFFDLGNSKFLIPNKAKIYAELELKPPADGFLIVTASANITSGASSDSEAQGTVNCELMIGKPSASVKRLKTIQNRVDGSANKKFKTFDSLASSTVTKVKAEKARKVALVCKPVDGAKINILSPALTVVYHPIGY